VIRKSAFIDALRRERIVRASLALPGYNVNNRVDDPEIQTEDPISSSWNWRFSGKLL
jgi:hypothetical protein